MLMEIEDFHGFDITVKVNEESYIPRREPPSCSNPSSAAFADPGEPGELDWDFVSAIPCDEAAIDAKGVITKFYNELDDKVFNNYEWERENG